MWFQGFSETQEKKVNVQPYMVIFLWMEKIRKFWGSAKINLISEKRKWFLLFSCNTEYKLKIVLWHLKYLWRK